MRILEQIGAQLNMLIQGGSLIRADALLENQIRSLPDSPFHIILDLSIRNDPADVARAIGNFLDSEAKRIRIKAGYTELNGFDINPDRWYCSFFAYSEDGGQANHDWLASWQSGRSPEYQIHGLEQLQRAYASTAFRNVKYREAIEICGLLVLVRFQSFIASALQHVKTFGLPLYVSAHDYDLIVRLELRP